MKKHTLLESLDLLQEYDFMGGPGMELRPDTSGVRTINPKKTNPRSWVPTDNAATEWPYEDDTGTGPANATGRTGQQGVGRGGVGLGGREDVSGGIREPSAVYTSTWQQDDEDDQQDEDADWEELDRHGSARNLWRDTPEADLLKKQLSNDEEMGESYSKILNKIKGDINSESMWTKFGMLVEAMGTPIKTGNMAPMDGPSLSNSRDAKPVEDEDGNPVSAQYIPPTVDPMLGPGNMWGGPGTIPGATKGWANSPKPGGRNNMRLREFFDPSPVQTEKIDNPDQDNMKDQSDEELELGDAGPPPNEPSQEFRGQNVIDSEDDIDGSVEIQGSMDAAGADDFAQAMHAAHDEPENGSEDFENILMLPNIGHGTDFMMSPDKMGAARGSFGLKADGAKAGGEIVDKSSAWDVLSKVVAALGGDEEETQPAISPGIDDIS